MASVAVEAHMLSEKERREAF